MLQSHIGYYNVSSSGFFYHRTLKAVEEQNIAALFNIQRNLNKNYTIIIVGIRTNVENK